MGTPKDVLHTLLDVVSGRRNLSPAQADELHEALDPGFTAPTDSPESIAAAQALLARQKLAADFQASQAAAAATPAEPAATPAEPAAPVVPAADPETS